VINGLLFYLVGNYVQGFHVSTVLAGILGALIYSIVSWVLSMALIPDKD
jgi:putative membrane protein